MPHVPFVQDRVPFAVEHTILLVQSGPHVSTEFRFVSQPSFVPPQSPKPEVQLLMPHAPLVHEAAPLAPEHAIRFPQVVPQAVVKLKSASHPFDTTLSQFPCPLLQLKMPHAPLEQDGVPFAAMHATPVPQEPAGEQVSTDAPAAAHRVVAGLHATHFEFKHASERQSASLVQLAVMAQWVRHVPPQSMSVSSPFLMVSPQVAPAHF
jgi:hypothetical protein